MPIYFLSLFGIPNTLAERIGSLMRNFIREGMMDGKKDPLVKWEVVSQVKEKEG